MANVDNMQDVLDSRDVIARRGELKEEREALAEALRELEEDRMSRYYRRVAAKDALATWDAENAEELAALEAFIAEGSDEWEHGVQLVRETAFEDHARELAEELGLLPREYSWPTSCIDWEHAARELQYDYTGADFAGVTYWFRG